ncbi:MAG: transglutaminase domain-containing protein, partial [Chloroflexi bacterium]|nr:transglutaminase domain-containing protein [Chloroflexota bacterium]
DLVRVHGDGNRYTVQSQVSQASPTMLRQTAVANIDPTILARYTPLPDSLPQRVRDLAAEVAAAAPNPYDQAVALEQFLRQYPYSLQIEGPPDADPVDYFLFEQQAGYCDYYASAMVVLARSLGLPARLGIGYLAQPPDGDNIQTMRQINGHSWAEIYFDSFGWVEFEPTAAFATLHSQTETIAAESASEDQPPEFAENVPPLPDVVEKRPFPWLRLFILGTVAAVFWWVWRQNRLPAGEDSVVWSYGRLQNRASKLGHPPSPSQTPQEYAAALQTGLNDYGRTPWLTKLVHRLHPDLAQLTALYVQRTYAGDEQSGGVRAWQSWQQVKRPLWLLRVVKLFSEKR